MAKDKMEKPDANEFGFEQFETDTGVIVDMKVSSINHTLLLALDGVVYPFTRKDVDRLINGMRVVSQEAQ